MSDSPNSTAAAADGDASPAAPIQHEPGDQLVPPASLTQVPRPLTPRARRRSWKELPVRIWVVLAVTVALITAYFTIDKYLSGRYERWLITSGLPVKAELNRIQGTREKTINFKRTDRLLVELNYEVPGHEKFWYIEGWLAQLPDDKPAPPIRVGDYIDIRVDPQNPLNWTDRAEPRPWVAEFTIVLMLLPLLAILVLVVLWRRRQVLKVWQWGDVAPGVVVETKQTAVAPFSRVLRFTFADGSDRRVFSALHPSKDHPKPGDVTWVIFPQNKPGKAVVASLYE